MKKYSIILFLTFFFVFFVGLVALRTSRAANLAYIAGNAWSSNTGWLKMDWGVGSTAYVDLDTGLMGGYAWSSSIGWVKFNPQENPPGSFVPQPAAINTTTGSVTGWIRACSVFIDGSNCQNDANLKPDSDRGGWDGWIELSGVGHPTGFSNGSQGVTYIPASGKLVGKAWGSPNMGWLDFCDLSGNKYCTTVTAPIGVTLSATNIVGDLTNGSFTTTLRATVNTAVGSGPYTFSFNCNINANPPIPDQNPPLVVPVPPSPDPPAAQDSAPCTYVTRGVKRARVTVTRNNAPAGSATLDILVKPPKPKFKENPPS